MGVGVSEGVWRRASALPWASTQGLQGIILRLTLDGGGGGGVCSAPLLPPTVAGLRRGAWGPPTSTPDNWVAAQGGGSTDTGGPAPACSGLASYWGDGAPAADDGGYGAEVRSRLGLAEGGARRELLF